jgi:hypothetical protein
VNARDAPWARDALEDPTNGQRAEGGISRSSAVPSLGPQVASRPKQAIPNSAVRSRLIEGCGAQY